MALKDEEDEYTFDEAMDLGHKRPLSLLEWLLYLENKEIIDKKLKKYRGELLKKRVLLVFVRVLLQLQLPHRVGRQTVQWFHVQQRS